MDERTESADLPHACARITHAVAHLTLPITYGKIFREYGICYQDGGTAIQLLIYCPFCGQKLPESLRDEWYERLDKLGIEDDEDPAIPPSMNSDAWWRASVAEQN